MLLCDSEALVPLRAGGLDEGKEMAGNDDLGAILKRIDERLEAVGMSDRAASIAAGMSADGIRTMRRQWKAGKQKTATEHTLSMLARPLHTTVPYLLSGIGDADIRDIRVQKAQTRTSKRVAKQAAKLAAKMRRRPRAAAVNNVKRYTAADLGGALHIAGEVAAGTWREEEAAAPTDQFDMRVPAHPDYPLSQQFAVVVRGNSISRVAAYNDVLVILDVAASGAMPRDGDLVVALRHRDGLYEYTAKRYCPAEDGKSVELRYDSLDPQFAKAAMLTLPIDKNGSVGEKADDGTEIRIKGIVLLIIRVP